MSYTLVATANFTRGLKRLSNQNRQRARKTIEEILIDPYAFKGLAGRYRELRSARFGDYRILYGVNEGNREIVLLAVEPRSQAYRR